MSVMHLSCCKRLSYNNGTANRNYFSILYACTSMAVLLPKNITCQEWAVAGHLVCLSYLFSDSSVHSPVDTIMTLDQLNSFTMSS